jgi:hypothetical protein
VRTLICSLLVAGGAWLFYAGSIRAEEPKKPDAAPKTEDKAAEPKKETVEDRMHRRKMAIGEAAQNQDTDKLLAVFEEILNDKEVDEDMRLEAGRTAFAGYVQEKHDGKKAGAVAKKLAEMKKDDSELLNELSWTILDFEGLENRDLDAAMSIAKMAAEASKYENSAILDTLARAYYEKGDLDKAVEYQTKAVEKGEKDEAIQDSTKDEMKQTLDKYKTKQAEKKAEKKDEKK